MKKLYILAFAALAATFVSCKDNEPEVEQSLSVEPLTLTFAAEGAPSQEVAVKAVGVEWDIEVSAASSEWLDAVKNGDSGITVSVADNPKGDSRVGAVVVTVPAGSGLLKNKEITVTQSGNDTPETFSIALSESKLTFAGEGAAPQTVKVTVEGEGLTWKAQPEGEAVSWITVETVEGGFSVSVSDNPETKKREGVVTVTPSEESAEPRSVIVTQEGKIVPPSLSVDVEEIRFDYRGNTANSSSILVTAENTDWEAVAEDENGESVEWFSIRSSMPDYPSLFVEAVPNSDTAERTGYVVITAAAEGVEPVRVRIVQDAAVDHLSELTADVDLTPVLKNHYIMFNPSNDWEPAETISRFDCRFWGDGIEHSTTMWPPFSGTGEYMMLYLNTSKVEFNDEKIYYIPDFQYPVAEEEYGLEPVNTVSRGGVSSWDVNTTNGSWYYRMENGAEVEKAPIVAGSMTVTRDGDTYTVKMEFEDDLGFKLTGEYTGTLDVIGNGDPYPNPFPGGDEGGGIIDPGFGQ